MNDIFDMETGQLRSQPRPYKGIDDALLNSAIQRTTEVNQQQNGDRSESYTLSGSQISTTESASCREGEIFVQ